ncbi:MAG: hypothetical protein ISS34_01280 [Candidatus Omnitrophica bacterium]|nr:hypothetical protein [Candidatus Omnitrophota bacterium]
MKIIKFIILVIFITSTTFLYAHQRIEAMRLSYEINKKEVSLDKLLDQRKELEYNVAKLKAPTYLELQLAKRDVKLVLPERWQVFEVSGMTEKADKNLPMPLFVRNIVGLFSFDKEAQATPASH